MAKVIFDNESRQFSVVEDQREYGVKESLGKAAGAVGKHVSKNSRAYITGGSSVAGAGVGAYVAKKRAEKAALAAGATPEEAKKVAKKAAIKGAAVGAAAGAVAGEAGQFGAKALKRTPGMLGDDGYRYKGKRQGFKGAAKEMYGKPFDAIKAKFAKKDKK